MRPKKVETAVHGRNPTLSVSVVFVSRRDVFFPLGISLAEFFFFYTILTLVWSQASKSLRYKVGIKEGLFVSESFSLLHSLMRVKSPDENCATVEGGQR